MNFTKGFTSAQFVRLRSRIAKESRRDLYNEAWMIWLCGEMFSMFLHFDRLFETLLKPRAWQFADPARTHDTVGNEAGKELKAT